MFIYIHKYQLKKKKYELKIVLLSLYEDPINQYFNNKKRN